MWLVSKEAMNNSVRVVILVPESRGALTVWVRREVNVWGVSWVFTVSKRDSELT